MNCTVLLQKLIAIERLIGRADVNTLRTLLYDAEDCVIQIQNAQEKCFFAEAFHEEASCLEPVA